MGWSALADRALRTALKTFRQDDPPIYRRVGLADVILQDAIFDATYFAVDQNTGAEVSSRQPVMGVRTADLPADRNSETDRILVNGVVYRITDVQPDGEAGTTLFLSKASRQ